MVSSILGCLVVTTTEGVTASPTPDVGLRMVGLLLTGPVIAEGADGAPGGGGGGDGEGG